MKSKLIFSTLFLSTCLCYASSQAPKLVVQIVVDQLRGDLIHQHQTQFGEHGFNYLLSHGLDFHNAHHPHANTTTCAGHATIATGSYPAMHGIVDNDWYDRKTNRLIYCMEDLSALPLTNDSSSKKTQGRSPRNLKASTISDEIILSHKGKAFAVSLKDRSAIALAGHAGKAFWFDKTNGGFTTTTYYYSAYPQWVSNWNNHYKPQNFTWDLSKARESYLNANTPVFPQKIKEFGQSFPHLIANAPSEQYFKFLSKTPKADQLTADFAEQLLVSEKLGKTENQTDYLGISFSAVDAIGHQFGPNSLEAEDNLLMLDKTIAHLLQSIDKQVGLDKVLIVLTADHGVSDSPSYLKEHHIAEIKPLNVGEASQKVISFLNERYQLPKETLMYISPPYVYLNHQIITQHRLNVSSISQSVAELLNHQAGVFKAYPLPLINIERDWLTAKVDRMAYPYRAGDVYLVQPPYQSRGAHNEDRVTHGSPWQYDSYVPLLFVNGKFKAQRIARPVFTTDIAPTLAALLVIKSPSAAVGEPLAEVLTASGHS
ncbi:alkaline phosphatase family protein [Legionella sp. km772]|uniref:alkaline phosphatase family protein n=1 Tax=Legionella sp. km772 TaxID=2498111 RepID=UPI000F8E797E|nr:alkaline phosphatase family protein [Legionella sp. km772]RUR12669.1 alkaline phosphatase family protein [Legionella sp. km772]